ncbi:MAG: 2,3-bisphosphoglycerate-dependent phosphoglycerate mutase, partial [Candidatus Thermoplasmatota archaeon]|nr:2,3-bisphosphoglycerate-dependent phosphoglycerate mutase [Candidatus Thermoplasmatota archaeon]
MGTLVLIRHGQSIWNAENRFTGWVDVGLSEKGIEEAKDAGRLLQDVQFDAVFASGLIRAQRTADIILDINKSWDGEQVR